MKPFWAVFLNFVLVFLSSSLSAQTFYVATNGSGTDGLTWETAFPTIQAAVNAAASESEPVTILVGSAGTGHGSGIYNENISISIDNLTLESESGPLQTTIQAASASAHAVSISSTNITVKGFSIYGSTSTDKAAIALLGADSCLLENNRCGWDSLNRNNRGIYLYNASNCTLQNNLCAFNTAAGIYISAGSGNRLVENTLEANGGPAIEITNSSTQNTLQKNRCTAHYTNPAIRLSATTYNVITQNICTGNYTGLALLSQANFNSITDNLFESSTSSGIELRNSSSQFLKNTSRLNYYGIYSYDSQYNTLLYNLFENNTSNVYAYYRFSEGDYWNSPFPLTYLYEGTLFSNKMGNYYSTYPGTDLDGDGIGETPYPLYETFSQDYFPLVSPPMNYLIQTWYASGEGTLSMEPNQPGQWQTIPSASSVVWLSDTVSLGDIDFNALSSEDGWNGQILFKTSVNGSDFEIEIGYADPNDSVFISGGPSAVLSGTQALFQFKTSPQSFTLPAGRALAVRMTNHSATSRQIFIGGGWTHIVPPAGTSDSWPGTPPTPSLNPADLNEDGWVNLLDWARLAAAWQMSGCGDLNSPCRSADIDQSGTVDFNDLELFAEFWMMGPDDRLPGDWNEDFRVDLEDVALLSAQWAGDLNQLIDLCENWLKGVF
jgi:parallel beta-helix repeat protein